VSTNPFPGNPFFQVPPFADDPFDLVLNSACSIWKKTSTDNTYGQPVDTYVLLADDVPCYVEQTSGKELNVPGSGAPSETSVGVATFLILLRPIKVDTPPVDLNIHHFLQVKNPGDTNLDPNDKNSGAVMYNVTDVDNPGRMNHHFEATATVIRP
jgi:hypothetical protein